MKLLFYFVVAILIAGNNLQEVAIGTDYLRAHANQSVALDSVTNVGAASTTKSAASTITTTRKPTTVASPSTATSSSDDNENDESNEDEDEDHGHLGVLTVDLREILYAFKNELQEMEERIMTAIRNPNATTAKSVLKSYRTADR